MLFFACRFSFVYQPLTPITLIFPHSRYDVVKCCCTSAAVLYVLGVQRLDSKSGGEVSRGLFRFVFGYDLRCKGFEKLNEKVEGGLSVRAG